MSSTMNLIGNEYPLAFHGAMGWGAETQGGCGGQILKVTNLNADGPGSFFEALNTRGPRIIVFEIGGVIDLGGKWHMIREPYLTITGQTAPSPGITFIRGGFSIRTHDVIIQHIAIRPGEAGFEKESGWEIDGIETRGYNIIIDHCSITWATDEGLSAAGRESPSQRITFSNNIIAEGLSKSTHSKGEHSKGSLIMDNAKHISVFGNLYAHNTERNPLFKGGVHGVVVNNFIYNFGSRAIHFRQFDGDDPPPGKMVVLGNYVLHGQDSRSSRGLMDLQGDGDIILYFNDNIALYPDGSHAPLMTKASSATAEYIMREEKPIWHDNIKVISAADVPAFIAINVGARPWDRDPIDQRIINEAFTGTGGIIDSENDREGYPDYELTYREFNQDEWDLQYMRPHVGYWPAPVTIYPENDAINAGNNMTFAWEGKEIFTSYRIQVATDEGFSSVITDESDHMEVFYTIDNLIEGNTYYWRIRGYNATGPSAWSEVWKFNTVTELINKEIKLHQGLNLISFNINPWNKTIVDIFSDVKNLIIVKNQNGEVFWRDLEINTILDWDYKRGYYVFVENDDSLKIKGYELQPELIPIKLSKGWNLVPYLRKSPMAIGEALSGIIDKVRVIYTISGEIYSSEVKNKAIGELVPGAAYLMYLEETATLFYPPND